MQRSILAAVLAAMAGTASANQPFDFQKQFGSEEYVHGANASHIRFAPIANSDVVPSLNALMLWANVDGIAPNEFHGTIVKSGPSRISLWEAYRDSPEGIAYRAYHERYPADTDWGRVAREYQAEPMGEGLASGLDDRGGRS